MTVDRRVLDRYEARIESVFQTARSLEPSTEVVSYLSRYMVVLISGYLEVSIRNLAGQYALRRSSREIASYVQRALRHSAQNPNVTVLLDVVGAFDNGWRARFEQFLQGERGEAINGVVDAKNKIAHGEDTSVGLYVARRWFEQCKESVNFLESLFN